MLKNIVVKVAIVVLSLFLVKPVAAADSKTIKEDRIVISPLCVFWICPPTPGDPTDPVMPSIKR